MKFSKKIYLVFFIFTLILFIHMFLLSVSTKYNFKADTSSATLIKDFQVSALGTNDAISLPYHFTGYKPGDLITLKTSISAEDHDCIYVKSVYSPLQIYFNEELIYESGQKGSYPPFLLDPPTTVAIVPLPTSLDEGELTFIYSFPSVRKSLTISPFLFGSENAILHNLCKTLGFNFTFSSFLLVFGFFLVIVSISVMLFDKKGKSFFFLGEFSLFVGLWSFSECNLTNLLISLPSLFYLLSFLGLFMLPIPLIHFGLFVIDFHHEKWLKCDLILLYFSLFVSVILQFAGIIPFSQSMYWFHFILPASLLLLAANIFLELLYYHSKSAKRFLVPFSILAFFSILEVINYRIHITYILSLFFLIGLILFIICNSIVCAFMIKDSLVLKEENKQLTFNLKIADIKIAAQKKHYEQVQENISIARTQRHDLRHQLIVLRGFCQAQEYDKLIDYINRLISVIPPSKSHIYCKNTPIDSILQYFYEIADQNGINCTLNFDIPEKMESITDNELCVVLANLLENAIEACCNVPANSRFIHLSTRTKYDILTITMDNSFNGKYKKEAGNFVSSKRDEIGIGLQSITHIATLHDGGTRFEASENTFQSSVYFRI